MAEGIFSGIQLMEANRRRFGGKSGGARLGPAAAELALWLVVRRVVRRAGRGAGWIGVWSGGAGAGSELALLRGCLSIFAIILHASV